MPRIGEIDLCAAPCAAIAIQEAVAPEAIRAAAGEHRVLVELRLDALGEHDPLALAAFAARYAGFPRLVTLRHADEGGGWRGGEAARVACYEAVLAHCEAVDVEICAGEAIRAVAPAARSAGRLVIGSFHDFGETPDDDRLASIYALGRERGADVVKVAARCNTLDDLRRLAAFTLAHRAEGVIVVGMGAYGLPSRVFFPALGSLVTYTFLGAPTAPGQLNCGDTLKYLDAFDPRLA
ncbi:MAG: type I 3-dehydroquinate dehydratase [Candidatus Hydrogenedentes bacterium]|nr:type I 3-dehydroquinate dehydratase [Candidatus Hydrogenedentota bacterium]